MAVPTMTNNSPQAGHISWGAFNIQLNGVAYSVSAGSTSQRWVWWKYNSGSPTIEAGPEVPATLVDDDLVLFANKNGIGVRVQSTSFVDGELLVDGSIFSEALSTNLINSQHIVTAGLDAGVIKFGTMHGDRIETNTLHGDKIIAGTLAIGDISGLVTELSSKASNSSVSVLAADLTSLDTRVNQGENYASNPYLQGDGPPTSYGYNGTHPTRTTTAGEFRTGSCGWKYAIAAGQTAYMTPGNSAFDIPESEYITVSVDFKYVEGDLAGSCILARWQNNSNYRDVRIELATEVPAPSPNTWYRIQKVVKRPSNYVPGPGFIFRSFLMAGYTALGTIGAKTIVFDRSDAWASTSEEIAAYNAPATAESVVRNLWGLPSDSTWIDGGKIYTNTVRANSLLIADYSNLVTNPDLAFGDHDWTLSTSLGQTRAQNSNYTSGWCIRSDNSVTTAGYPSSQHLPRVYNVKQGDQFYLSALVQSEVGVNTAPTLRVSFMNSQNTSAGITNSNQGTSGASTNGAYVERTLVATAPAGTDRMRIWVEHARGSSPGIGHIGAMSVRRRNAGELIVDGTIIGTHIKGDTITGNHLKGETITGDKIAANAIAASRLAISDLTNYIHDGAFLYGNASWSIPGASGLIVTSSSEPNYLQVTTEASGNNDQVNRNVFEVKPGDEFYVEGEVWASSANAPNYNSRVNILMYAKNAAGTNFSWPSVFVTAAQMAAAPNTWIPISGTITVPSGAHTASFGVSVSGGVGAGKVYRFRNLKALRKANGWLIVDGTVASRHVVTEGLDAGVVKFGFMHGDRIAVGTINANHIGANAIQARNLDVGEATNALPPLSNWDGPAKEGYLVDTVGPVLVIKGNGSTNTHVYTALNPVTSGDIPVVPGEQFTFSWDVYANYAGYSGSTVPYFITYNGDYSANTQIVGPATPQGTNAYERKEFTFTVPAGRTWLRFLPYVTPTGRSAIRNPQLRRAAGMLTVSGSSGGVRISNYTNPANGSLYQGVVDFLVNDSDAGTWTNGRMFSQMFNNSWNSNKRTGAIRITAPYVTSQGVSSAPYIDIRRADNRGELFVSADHANFLANSFLFSSQDASVVDFTLQYSTKNVFSFRGKGGGPKIDMQFGVDVFGGVGNILMAAGGSTGAEYGSTWLSIMAQRLILNSTAYSGAALYVGANQNGGTSGPAYLGTNNVGLRFANDGVLNVEGALGNSLQIKAYNVNLLSDRSTKESLRGIEPEGVLDRLRQTKVYDWSPKGTAEFLAKGLISKKKASRRFRGIIADEAETTLPEIVIPPSEDDPLYGVDLYAYVSTLHAAIVELSERTLPNRGRSR